MKRTLDQIAAQAVEQYHQRQALIFFEAAFGALLDAYPLLQAKHIAQSYMTHMEEFWGEMPESEKSLDWDAWFEANRDRLGQLLRDDAEGALFEAWLAGMEYGGAELAKFVKGLK